MNIDVEEKLGAGLSQVAAGLTDPERQEVSETMGAGVRSLIVRHLSDLAASRHTTAEKLGASPTGYIRDLADNFDQSSTVEVDADGVSLHMRHPVLSRALHDVTILPRKQFLVIPMNAIAYGRRPGEFAKNYFMRGRSAKPIPDDRPAWLLVRSVTQRRDPTLLPTLDQMTTAAAKAAGGKLRELLIRRGLL